MEARSILWHLQALMASKRRVCAMAYAPRSSHGQGTCHGRGGAQRFDHDDVAIGGQAGRSCLRSDLEVEYLPRKNLNHETRCSCLN